MEKPKWPGHWLSFLDTSKLVESRQQPQVCLRPSLLTPSQAQRGKRRRGEGSMLQGLLCYFHSLALVLHPSSREIKDHLYSGSATQVTHLGWATPCHLHPSGNYMAWWPGLEKLHQTAVVKGLGNSWWRSITCWRKMGENGRLSRHNGSTEFEIRDQSDGSDKG